MRQGRCGIPAAKWSPNGAELQKGMQPQAHTVSGTATALALVSATGAGAAASRRFRQSTSQANMPPNHEVNQTLTPNNPKAVPRDNTPSLVLAESRVYLQVKYTEIRRKAARTQKENGLAAVRRTHRAPRHENTAEHYLASVMCAAEASCASPQGSRRSRAGHPEVDRPKVTDRATDMQCKWRTEALLFPLSVPFPPVRPKTRR